MLLGPLIAVLIILSIVALLMSISTRSELDHYLRKHDSLSDRVNRIEKLQSAKTPAPVEQAPEPATAAPGQQPVEEPKLPAEFQEEPTAPPIAMPVVPPDEPVQPEPAMAQPTPLSIEAEWWSNMEAKIGKRWMVWAGALALFLGVGFFVKYAIDHRWIGPTTRVICGCAFGLVLIGLGYRFLRKKMRAFGQGLVGGGLAMLYVSIFAAFQFYGLIRQPIAFVLLVAVSAVGMTLSVIHDAMPISFIAILGGFLTPVLISTGQNERDLLFAYLLLLDLSVLGIGFFKKWRALDVLAFIGTAWLFGAWYDKFYEPSVLLPTLAWLGAFYVTFLLLPFVGHLRRKTPATVERFVMALVSSTGVFAFAYNMLYPDNSPGLSLVALSMGACCLVMGVLFATRVKDDKRGLLGFIALAITFLTISIPIYFKLNGITLCWAAEAPLLIYLGYKFKYRPVRVGGIIVLGITVLRLFVKHLPLHSEEFTFILNTRFATAMCVPLSCALFAVIHQLRGEHAGKVDHVEKVIGGILAGFLALIVLHTEIAQFFKYSASITAVDHRYYGLSSACVLWSLGALAFLFAGIRLRSRAACVVGFLGILVAVFLTLFLYERNFLDDYLFMLNIRFLAAFVMVLAFFSYGLVLCLRRQASGEKPSVGGRLLCVIGGAGLLILLNTESLTFSHHHLAWSGVTALWALGAAGFLFAGIKWRSLESRIAGIAALVFASGFAVRLYYLAVPAPYWLFLNVRFAAALLAALMMFIYGFVLLRSREQCSDEERSLAKILYAMGTLFLLGLLSVEVYKYCRGQFADIQKARWMAQMALTVTWSIYASAMLTIGFWKRVRAVRFAALALFGITAIKLLIVDIAWLDQIYRIISFMAMGLLMIGGSYLYHRAEKLLGAEAAEK